MKEITTQELKELITSGKKFTLLDCRGVDYFNWEHIIGAQNLRWKYVRDRAGKLLLDKKSIIVTSCDGFTCAASVRCLKELTKLGYTNILEYSGGLADWKANGNETVTNDRFKIATNVYRFPEQTFYGEDVGSYLIEEKDFLVLIDGPQQLTEEHEDFIDHFDKPVKLFMSHGPTAGEAKKLQKEYRAKIYLHKNDGNNQWLTVKPDVLVDDGYKFADHLQVIHVPGHTPGSALLLDTKNKILFSGDHVEGDGREGIYDFVSNNDGTSGDIRERLASAKKLLAYDFDKILPFHYSMIQKDAKKILAHFLKQHEYNNH